VLKSYVQELDHDRADGTFDVEFRRYENCRLVFVEKEGGLWSISDGTVHQVTTSVNGRPVNAKADASLIDDYKILVLDDHDYQSKWTKTGEVMKVWRVNEHFEFPKCDFTS
jgi:hypothetical protein